MILLPGFDNFLAHRLYLFLFSFVLLLLLFYLLFVPEVLLLGKEGTTQLFAELL